jgi:hypothetical protein
MHFSFREIPVLQKEEYCNAFLFQRKFLYSKRKNIIMHFSFRGNSCTAKGRIL